MQLGLLDILDGDQAGAAEGIVHHQQLFDRCWCSSRLASSLSTVSRTVIRSGASSAPPGWSGSEAKRTSRWSECRPACRPGCRRRWQDHGNAGNAEIVISFSFGQPGGGRDGDGLMTMPDSKRFTRALLRPAAPWTGCGDHAMPPPGPARSLARFRSPCPSRRKPTESEADRGVKRVSVLASAGSTEDALGTSRTSSKVRASLIIMRISPAEMVRTIHA